MYVLCTQHGIDKLGKVHKTVTARHVPASVFPEANLILDLMSSMSNQPITGQLWQIKKNTEGPLMAADESSYAFKSRSPNGA